MRELERDSNDIHAPEQALPPIAVIGRGRVGGSVASTAAVAGLDVRQAGRDEFEGACREAEIALLCVPDAEIEAAAERAARLVPPLRLVGHVSGSAGLDALAAAAAAGAEVFSIHPLQTVPDDRTPLEGAPAAIGGSGEEALGLARELAERLGMRPFELPEASRAAYHAAASMASNFLVTLEESAAGLLTAAGVKDGRELLAPLVLRSAVNWSERGAAALTGPIVRGDAETVNRHRRALSEIAPDLLPTYDALAERTRSLGGSGDGDGNTSAEGS